MNRVLFVVFFPCLILKGPAGEPPRMTASDSEEELEGLPLVDALLPKHSSMSLRLPSPKDIPMNKGIMYSTTHAEKSEAKGEKWLENFEVQMMLGMILRDARYDGHVTIIPFYITQIMEFTKKEVKELDWPCCGPCSRIGSDGVMSEVVAESSEDAFDVGSNVEMAEVVDPLGNKASDAVKLFPDLAGSSSKCSAAAISVARKQLSTDETDVEDDDRSVVPEEVKNKTPTSSNKRHLYSFDPEPGDPP